MHLSDGEGDTDARVKVLEEAYDNVLMGENYAYGFNTLSGMLFSSVYDQHSQLIEKQHA